MTEEKKYQFMSKTDLIKQGIILNPSPMEQRVPKGDNRKAISQEVCCHNSFQSQGKDKIIIDFISTFEMYDKEEFGLKPNTLRILSFDKEQKLKKATHVRIRRGYTSRCFIRKITDKTAWKINWIISWNPNEVLQ